MSSHPLSKKVLEKIEAIRSAKKISQEKMAAQLYCSPDTYRRKTKGSTGLTLDCFFNIATVLQTSPDSIIQTCISPENALNSAAPPPQMATYAENDIKNRIQPADNQEIKPEHLPDFALKIWDMLQARQQQEIEKLQAENRALRERIAGKT